MRPALSPCLPEVSSSVAKEGLGTRVIGPHGTRSPIVYTCEIGALSSILLTTSRSLERSGKMFMATCYLGRGRAKL